MTDRMTERMARASGLAVVAVAGLAIAAFAVVALVRMTYPFELEWMEGGSVDTVRRILAGRPVYVRPSMEFTPFIYTPLYFWVCAPFMALIGEGFVALRLVSILSACASMAILFVLVRKETGFLPGAALAAGLFAATFKASGAWLDLARVDSLFMLFVLASILVLRRREDLAHGIAAGVFMFFAFFTKQTALVVAAPLCVHCLVARGKWSRVAMPATLALLVAASTLAGNALTDGWYGYYVFDLPGQHPLRPDMWLGFWVFDILPTMGVALAASVAFLATRIGRDQWRDLLFHACVLAGLAGASWSSRLHTGGWLNSLIPVHAGLALYMGMAVAGALGARAGGPVAPAAARWHMATLLVNAACIGQLSSLYWPPAAQIPTMADAGAGRSIVRLMGRFDKEVWMTNHGYIPIMAGKKPHAQGMAVSDVLRGTDEALRDALLDEMRTAIRERRFDVIVTDERGLVEDWVLGDIQRAYRYAGDAIADPDIFWPRTGHTLRPGAVYVRP